MALRTIADLPALDVDKIIEQPELMQNLEESLFEISYMEALDQYNTYKSKHVKFRGLSGLIVEGIVNGDEYNFYGYKIFWDGIEVHGVLNLSGDLYVNTDMTKEEWSQYTAIINAGTIQLNSINMQLCAEQLGVYTDHGQFKSYDGNTVFVDWNSQHFNVNVPFNAANISCNNLTSAGDAHFNGTAHFTNVIDGTALRAKWADLAEFYRSDADYRPGTLVKFGGEYEITIADGEANAVVTDKPGLMLNGQDGRDGIYKGIALVGRTPVKVVGPVSRFDRLVPDPEHPGSAVRALDN